MKTNIEQLAIFGGAPLFDSPLAVGTPNIGDRNRFHGLLNGALTRRWLTNGGPLVQELELRLRDFLGVRHCVATANATVALELVARSLGLSGEVIVPSFTFIATANAFAWLGLRPRFCDIHRDTLNIDARHAETLINADTSAIVGVHLFGRPCEVRELTRLCADHDLHLLFDASHALGCSYRGQRIGRFGKAEVFSFHATKIVNAFEGGAITTDDDELAEQLRLMRNHGFVDYDAAEVIGTNAKLNEASAAMALTSLESFDEFVDVNHRNQKAYAEGLKNLRGVSLHPYDESEENNFHYVVVIIDSHEAGISRDELQRVLWAENVLARRYFSPGCHRMAAYSDSYVRLGETEEAAERIMCLPTGAAVGTRDVSQICSLIRFVIENSSRLADALAVAADDPSSAVST